MTAADLLSKSIDLFEPVLLLAASWLALVVANWIRAKVKNEYLRAVMLRLDDAVFTAVRELEQTTVAYVKDASADGKIDAIEALEIRDKAVARCKAYLGPKGIGELEKAIGPKELAALLEGKLEAAVHDLRNGG